MFYAIITEVIKLIIKKTTTTNIKTDSINIKINFFSQVLSVKRSQRKMALQLQFLVPFSVFPKQDDFRANCHAVFLIAGS